MILPQSIWGWFLITFSANKYRSLYFPISVLCSAMLLDDHCYVCPTYDSLISKYSIAFRWCCFVKLGYSLSIFSSNISFSLPRIPALIYWKLYCSRYSRHGKQVFNSDNKYRVSMAAPRSLSFSETWIKAKTKCVK